MSANPQTEWVELNAYLDMPKPVRKFGRTKIFSYMKESWTKRVHYNRVGRKIFLNPGEIDKWCGQANL